MPADPLDTAEPVAEWDSPPPVLTGLVKEWPTGALLREEMYQRDLEENAQPPVFHVTITPPEGQPAIPGFYEVTTGPQPVTTYHPEPDTEPLRKVLPLTRKAADRVSTQPHEWLLPEVWKEPEDEADVRAG